MALTSPSVATDRARTAIHRTRRTNLRGEGVRFCAHRRRETRPEALLRRFPSTDPSHAQSSPMQTERTDLKHDASNFDDYMLLVSLIALVGVLALV